MTFEAKIVELESWTRQSQSLEQQLVEQLQVNQRQAKELKITKIKQKTVVDNMLLAQKILNDMLQLSSSKERMQMLLELQTLRIENQMLQAKVQQLKAQRRTKPIVPRQEQE